MMPDIRIALRLAIRHKFLVSAAWMLVLVVGIAWLSAEFSGRQPATVALDVGLSVIRLGLPVVGLLLLQELLAREFERRFFLVSLTYPRSRLAFLLGRFLTVAGLLTALLVVLAAALAGTVAWLAHDYEQATPVALGAPYLLTLAFTLVDLYVVLAVGTMLAVVVTTPSFVLVATLGFMWVARSFSSIMALLQQESWLVTDAQTYRASLGILGYLIPDLAVLDIRPITLYGHWGLLSAQWPWQVLAAWVYGSAALALAAWLLARRRFS